MQRFVKHTLSAIEHGHISYEYADRMWDYRSPDWKDLEPFVKPMRFSRGNTKLDSSVFIWSLPSIFTCPNCEGCKDRCYAHKAEIQYPSVRRFRFINYLLVKYYPKGAERLIVGALNKSRKCTAVRIHESGDFYSSKYVDFWGNIAQQVKTRFYLYTKVSDAERLGDLPNVNVVKSVLPDGSINFGSREFVEEKQKAFNFPVCPVTQGKVNAKCGKTCKLCQKVPNVLFVEH